MDTLCWDWLTCCWPFTSGDPGLEASERGSRGVSEGKESSCPPEQLELSPPIIAPLPVLPPLLRPRNVPEEPTGVEPCPAVPASSKEEPENLGEPCVDDNADGQHMLARLPVLKTSDLDDLEEVSAAKYNATYLCSHEGRRAFLKIMDVDSPEMGFAKAGLPGWAAAQTLAIVDVGSRIVAGVLFEAASRDLLTRLCKFGFHHPREERLWVAMQHMLHKLLDIHACNILHLDIKPENVLVFPDGNLKYCDFGAAEPFDRSILCGISFEGPCGTMGYMAPELLGSFVGRHSWANEKSDVYSLGCTFFVMVRGRLPHLGAEALRSDDAEAKRDLMVRMATGASRMAPATGFEVLDVLLDGMLRCDAGERWTVQDALEYVTRVRQNPNSPLIPMGSA